MQAEQIEQLIKQGVPGAEVVFSGEGCSSQVVVVSPAFEGKSLLQQQRMVNASLGTHFADGSLHALSIKTYTPAQWEAAKQGRA